jgi:hypothetical protein
MTIEPRPLPYKLLKRKHREHDADYWRELRVLYEGGRRLLRDVETLKKVLHRHAGETDQHYGERLARAFYVNVLATALDFIVAGLNLDPIRMIPPGGPETKADEFYEKFAKNTAPAGADDRVPLQELVREQVRDGLLLGRWATLVDLPPAVAAVSEADQRAQGALDAYAIPITIEEVLDWHTRNGRLEWIVRCQVQQDRTTPEDDGSTIVETYTVYTADQWWRYVVTYTDPKKQGGEKKDPPKDDEVVPLAGPPGRHSFGRVPLILHVLPPGLWAGNKLASIVKEHFNKSNILAYAEVKDGLQQLYEFLGTEIGGVDTPISEKQTDAGRAQRQPRGPGLVQVRGKDDRAEYVGPDTSGMAQMRDSVKAAREDAFRVVYQMALAEDNKGALVGRSAESKGMDHAAAGVMLGAMGEEGREHAVEIFDTVAKGRQDEPGWTAQGLERFEVSDVSEQIDQAVLLETVSIPSATYQVERKVRLAKSDLGAAATDKLMETIRDELQGAITQDQLEMGGMLGAGMLPDEDGKPVPAATVPKPVAEGEKPSDSVTAAKAKPGKAAPKKPAAKPAPPAK